MMSSFKNIKQSSSDKCCECCKMDKKIKEICEKCCKGEKGDKGDPGESGSTNIKGLQMQLIGMADQTINDIIPFDTIVFNNANNIIEENNGTFTIKENGLYYISYQIGYEIKYATTETPTIALYVNNAIYCKSSCWNNSGQITGTALISVSDANTTIFINDDTNSSMTYKDNKVQANIVITKLT